jgi:hypothetical protein
MKYQSLMIVIGLGFSIVVFSINAYAEKIYRCGNEYTNTPKKDKKSTCRTVNSSNVSIMEIPAPKNVAQEIKRAVGAAPSKLSRANRASDEANPSQKSKDIDALKILELELRKEKGRFDQLSIEYSNSLAAKIGPEHKNNQMYLDRVSVLKDDLDRVQGNIDALNREIARHNPRSATTKDSRTK